MTVVHPLPPTLPPRTMAEALAMGKRSVERDIAILREAGYIAKSGKDNRSPWVVLKREDD